MAFQGSLKDLPLPDIIQLVSVSGKTGMFELKRDGERGEIYLRDGQIVHSTVENLTGEEAIYTLAIWSHGEFQFMPGQESPATTISRSNTNLLMEAARRLDEWRVLSKKIPSTELVPHAEPRDGSVEPVSLNPMEWSVVVRVDGKRSIEDIARSMRTTPFDVAKTLYGLMTADLIVLKKAAPAPASGASPTTATGKLARARIDDPKALATLANRITEEASGFLGAQGQQTVERSLRQALADLDGGRGVDAVRELVRQYERAISAIRGPAATKEFLDRAASLVSTGA